MASRSEWNLWVWLLGVVVRRYIDFLILLIPTPLVSVRFSAAFLLFVHFYIPYIYDKTKGKYYSKEINMPGSSCLPCSGGTTQHCGSIVSFSTVLSLMGYCTGCPKSYCALQFLLQQILEMSPTGLKTSLDTLYHIVRELLQCGRCDLLNVGGDCYLQLINCEWIVFVDLSFQCTPQIKVQRTQVRTTSKPDSTQDYAISKDILQEVEL